ncbi:MAG: hypothetical protein REJ50_19865, partial [Bordetella sp.]|nr:hypothetical protein [Bordetella sp.]
MSTEVKKSGGLARAIVGLIGILVGVFGAILAYNGAILLSLGGSAYYLPVGLVLLAAGGLLALRRLAGAWLFAVAAIASVIWAIAEAGTAFWPLLGRLGAFGALGLLVALVTPCLPAAAGRRGLRSGSYAVAAVLALVLIGAGVK